MPKCPERPKRIVILTGAGISAESGLGTFRDKDGLWTKYDLRDVATPEGFARNPEFVLEFYAARRGNSAEAEPNPAHFALGALEQKLPGEVLVVTQNIDNLHERAGTTNLLHMHGIMDGDLCNNCGNRQKTEHPLTVKSICPACGTKGMMRPDVVWFGEMPYHMGTIEEALLNCDTFVSIGTSGEVYPAAGFVAMARDVGAHTIELNLEPSSGDHLFAEKIYGPASEVVPRWVETML